MAVLSRALGTVVAQVNMARMVNTVNMDMVNMVNMARMVNMNMVTWSWAKELTLS